MIRAAVSWPLAARKASRAGVSFQGSTATSSAAACDCPALGRWGRGSGPARLQRGLHADQDGVEPAVVVPLELEHQAPPGGRPGHPQRRLHHLRPGGAEAHPLGAGHQGAEAPRQLDLPPVLPGEELPLAQRRRHGRGHRRGGVPQDAGPHPQYVVKVDVCRLRRRAWPPRRARRRGAPAALRGGSCCSPRRPGAPRRPVQGQALLVRRRRRARHPGRLAHRSPSGAGPRRPSAGRLAPAVLRRPETPLPAAERSSRKRRRPKRESRA